MVTAISDMSDVSLTDHNLLKHEFHKNLEEFRHLKNCCNYPKIGTLSFYYLVMCPNDADRMANSVNPDQTAPSLDLSVRKLRIIMVHTQLNLPTRNMSFNIYEVSYRKESKNL